MQVGPRIAHANPSPYAGPLAYLQRGRHMSDLAFRDPLGLLDWSPRLFSADQDALAMRVEEYEHDNTLVIKAEVPGIDPDKDVKISVTDGRLRIAAHRHETSSHRDKDSYRSEFHYGLFVRDIALPFGVNRDDVAATYKDGVLTVQIPMSEVKEEAATIPVKHE